MEDTMWRWLNGDLENGIMFADSTNDLLDVRQSYAVGLKGQLLLPVFGLQGGDIILQVDTGAGACTRTYTPVIVSPLTAKTAPVPRQTERVSGNAARATIAPTKN
jgi:hypothetical protein